MNKTLSALMMDAAAFASANASNNAHIFQTLFMGKYTELLLAEAARVASIFDPDAGPAILLYFENTE